MITHNYEHSKKTSKKQQQGRHEINGDKNVCRLVTDIFISKCVFQAGGMKLVYIDIATAVFDTSV